MTNVEIGRLMLRVEGDWWRAYYGLRQDSMDGAVCLGSIAMKAVQNLECKEAFITLMRGVVSDLIEDAIGVDVEWGGVHPGPESEKAGRA